ncbi:hypothetical protein V2J09_017449 [Rumex salicifolius]
MCKYLVLAPWAIHSIYLYMFKEEKADSTYIIIFPFLILRMIHNQLWISFSRYRTSRGDNLIIIFNGILFYVGNRLLENAQNMPFWRTNGIIMTILLHMGPVEFLYYWLHRALHHHFLYSPVIHPFAEHISYFILFAIPILSTIFTRTCSIAALGGYILYLDLMNNMGHCNFEHIPKRLFTIFPPLKYLMYTPTYHSLHHTQFRTNYSLFMPFYDYLYGTMDQSSDSLYKTSLEKPQDSPDVVYLTHLTTPQSIYHLRIGFASLASNPFSPKWYLWLMWPITFCSIILTWIYGHTFIVDRHTFDKLKLQSWSIPRYTKNYSIQWQSVAINELIEEAILEADNKNVKVLSLGLLNQSQELNQYGEFYIQKLPKLKVKLVDGSSLAIAVILNNITKGTTEVLFRGKLSKIAYSVIYTLCQRGIQISTSSQLDYEKLKMSMAPKYRNRLAFTKDSTCKTWLVGEDLTENEQFRAPKETTFIPISQFPPKRKRKDCFYLNTPAMLVPSSLGNLHSCENWLPRKAMSAWRVAGIVHALEGWNVHECGDTIFDVGKVWQASISHGFRPLQSLM